MKVTPLEYHDLRGRLANAADAEPVQLAAVRAVEARATEVRDYLVALRDTRAAAILTPDPNVRRTVEQREASDHAEDDVRCLERGLWGQGFWDSSLKPSMDSVGIATLDRLIGDCRDVIEREERRPTLTWPAPFRYVGKPGVAELNGNLLRPGDVVELNEGQAAAWADRFVPADAEQPTATS